MENRYAEKLRQEKHPLFIPFATLGDPNKEDSLKIVQTLIDNGADALEIGFPFSDPPADGPVIQASYTRALDAGVKVDDCFDLLKSIRSATDIPIGLLVYYNLILQRGIEKFYKDCSSSGVTSVLVADLPLEHKDEILAAAKGHKIQPVFMVSELADDERIAELASAAEGYLYVVSHLGVTGTTNMELRGTVRSVIEKVRKQTQLPLCVGFGINTPEQAGAILEAGADGIIIGSRLVKESPNLANIAEICCQFKAVTLRLTSPSS